MGQQSKDFQSKQIRTTQIIASGGIKGPTGPSSIGLLIYSASDASDYSGGLTHNMTASVGGDTWLFISGAKDGRQLGKGVSVFGGDVVVSGTFFAERMVAEVDQLTTGSLFVSGAINVRNGGTFNITQQDHDFQVNAHNKTHMLFVDAGNKRVGIGTSSPDSVFHIDNGASNTELVLEKDAGTSASIVFHTAGTPNASIAYSTNEDIAITNDVSDKDIIFTANDGGIKTEIARFDGSEGSFLVASGKKIQFADTDEHISSDGTNLALQSGGDIHLTAEGNDIKFVGSNDQPAFSVTISGSAAVLQTQQSGEILKLSAGGDLKLAAGADMEFDAGGNDFIFVGSNNQQVFKVTASGSRPVLTAVQVGESINIEDNVGIGAANVVADGILHLDAGTSNTIMVIEKDAGTSGSITFHTAGVPNAAIDYSSNEDLEIRNDVSDKDIIFKATDGGVKTEIARFDGSEGSFLVASGKKIQFADTSNHISSNGSVLSVTGKDGINLDHGNGYAYFTGSSDLAYLKISNSGSAAAFETMQSGEALLLSAGGDIIFDADGADIFFKDGGTEVGSLNLTGTTNMTLRSKGDLTFDVGSEKTILFKHEGSQWGEIGYTSSMFILTASQTDDAIALYTSISGSSKQHAKFGAEQVLILSGGAATSANEAAGTDVAFYVSGTVDSVTTSNRGASLFGGDVVVSGSAHAVAGFSGSLTRLTNGKSFIEAGSNITITSASNGAVTVASTGGASIANDANNRVTTAVGDGTLNGEANLTFDGTDLSIASTGKVEFGAATEFIHGPGSNAVRVQADGDITLDANGNDFIFVGSNDTSFFKITASGSHATLASGQSGEGLTLQSLNDMTLDAHGNDFVFVGSNDQEFFKITASGSMPVLSAVQSGEKIGLSNTLIPTTDNAIDLGSATNRFQNIYTGDLHLKNDRGDWTIIEESDYLSVKNNNTGNVYRITMELVDEKT